MNKDVLFLFYSYNFFPFYFDYAEKNNIGNLISVSIQSSEVTQAVFLCSINILMGMLLTFVFKAKTVYV